MGVIATSKVEFSWDGLDICVRVTHLPGLGEEEIISKAKGLLRAVYDINMDHMDDMPLYIQVR